MSLLPYNSMRSGEAGSHILGSVLLWYDLTMCSLLLHGKCFFSWYYYSILPFCAANFSLVDKMAATCSGWSILAASPSNRKLSLLLLLLTLPLLLLPFTLLLLSSPPKLSLLPRLFYRKCEESAEAPDPFVHVNGSWNYTTPSTTCTYPCKLVKLGGTPAALSSTPPGGVLASLYSYATASITSSIPQPSSALAPSGISDNCRALATSTTSPPLLLTALPSFYPTSCPLRCIATRSFRTLGSADMDLAGSGGMLRYPLRYGNVPLIWARRETGFSCIGYY